MTTATASTWPDATPSALATVRQHLPVDGLYTRALWDTLQRAYPRAAATLARPDGALTRALRPRADLSDAQRQQLQRTRATLAREVLEDAHRALLHSPRTLAALAAGTPAPVHPDERAALATAVSRRLLVAGCVTDEVTLRRATDGCLAAVGEALAALPA